MNIALHSSSPTSISYVSVSSQPKDEAQKKDSTSTQASSQKTKNPQKLNEDEKRVVRDLQSRDSQVKAHEAAHQAAGGGMTGAASYTYQQGPDGKMYAIGGEVSISTKGGSTPQEAIANARQVAAAAMAPANPSAQDYSVASSARVMEMKAQQQLSRQRLEEIQGKESYKNSSSTLKMTNIDLEA
ncbi:putative metalloprotease CJM1_0395 family protein [Sulfurimonas sp.]